MSVRDPREFEMVERLRWSEGVVAGTCMETIRSMIDGCVSVQRVTDATMQRRGIDYVATLRRGAEVLIDHKARERGCSRWWTDRTPELALEVWSVVPCAGCPKGRVGWSLDEEKATDYTLHTFDDSDSPMALLVPFQLLRVAFRRNGREWLQAYRSADQWTSYGDSGWTSRCVFVPWPTVRDAMTDAMEGFAA